MSHLVKLFSNIYFLRSVPLSVRTCRASTAATESNIKQNNVTDNSSPKKCDSSKGLRNGQKSVIVAFFEENNGIEMTAECVKLDKELNGIIKKNLDLLTIRFGDALVLANVEGYKAVALTSVGPKSPTVDNNETLDIKKENIRIGIGAAARELLRYGISDVSRVDPVTDVIAAAEGWYLGNYDGIVRKNLTKYSGFVEAQAQNWARMLTHAPANKAKPTLFAKDVQAEFSSLKSVKITAYDYDWILSQKMECFLTVARGSCERPKFLECVYNGGGTAPKILICAKGVTFSSGGLSRKDEPDMAISRGNKAGAAVAVAVLKAIAEKQLKLNVSCVIPLCENLISGQCMKVGEVVKTAGGKTIYIEDADFEGPLIMADALEYGIKTHKPNLVVTVATLTNVKAIGVGSGGFPCYTNNDKLWSVMRSAGSHAGDRPWRMPLWTHYADRLDINKTNKTDHQSWIDADDYGTSNKGSSPATSCTGAAFLKQFIDSDWVHMDISGVAMLPDQLAPAYLDSGTMTGRPTRTIIKFLEDISKENISEKSDHTPDDQNIKKCQAQT